MAELCYLCRCILTSNIRNNNYCCKKFCGSIWVLLPSHNQAKTEGQSTIVCATSNS
ncbi:unnamed protein product [Moneuplotes crassus]|uniref:Uncharacterized protein n=1 Tax=Euplotes crassus TaxID=5936 RepID=A0AAD1XG88_EUPCR|nr:unnamed protein product [Moneuplotes crassus]